jgi:PPOX class probable F420-dependent enzyme
MHLGDEKYLLMTTFRRTGEPVSTPVCAVPIGDRVGIYTASDSGKAKRLRHTTRVLLQPSSPRGKPTPGSAAVGGTAELDQSRLGQIVELARKKYPLEYRLSKLVMTLMDTVKRKPATFADTAVVVTVDAPVQDSTTDTAETRLDPGKPFPS